MPVIAAEDYDKSVIPSFLKADEKDLIDGAVMCGWTIHIGGGNNVTLIAPSPHEQQKIHLGRRNSVPIKRMRAKVVKYADPLKLALANTAADDSPAGEAALRGMNATIEDDGYIHADLNGKVTVEVPEPQSDIEDTLDATPEVATVATDSDTSADLTTSEEAQTYSVHIPDAHVISVKPLLVKGGTGRAYESETTLERTWSDRTLDYICTQCDYYSAERLSVSRHYANVHSRGKGAQPQPPTFKSEVPGAAAYGPRQSRVDALADYLATLDRGEDLPWTVVARHALTWVHEQSAHQTDLAAEAEPMSEADTLNRIRSLLDKGDTVRHRQQVEEMEQRLIETQQRLVQAEELALEQTAKAERAASNLESLRELVSELAGEGKS